MKNKSSHCAPCQESGMRNIPCTCICNGCKNSRRREKRLANKKYKKVYIIFYCRGAYEDYSEDIFYTFISKNKAYKKFDELNLKLNEDIDFDTKCIEQNYINSNEFKSTDDYHKWSLREAKMNAGSYKIEEYDLEDCPLKNQK